MEKTIEVDNKYIRAELKMQQQKAFFEENKTKFNECLDFQAKLNLKLTTSESIASEKIDNMQKLLEKSN